MAINKSLFRKIKKHILEEPRRYNQGTWVEESDEVPCGTAACIAGWACILSGKNPIVEDFSVLSTASDLLGLTPKEAGIVFDSWASNWPERYENDFWAARSRGDKEGQAKAAAAYLDYIIATGKVTE